MLYLKPVILNIFALPKKDLTLTSVVFETNVIDLQPLPLDDLTLTSVVFENISFILSNQFIKFNFNKCCIWNDENLQDSLEVPTI